MKMAFHRTLLLFNQRPLPNPPHFLRANTYFCFSQNFVTDAKLFSLTDSRLPLVFWPAPPGPPHPSHRSPPSPPMNSQNFLDQE